MAREYDNIADAISAVNGEVGEQSGKIANILEALEGKAGGGLPPFIHKTNHGEFSFQSATLLTAQIEHGLGELPRGVFIWSDDAITAGFWWGLLYRSSNVDYSLLRFGLMAPSKENLYADMASYQSTTLTDTFFSFNHGGRYYQGGINYKWFAWA